MTTREGIDFSGPYPSVEAMRLADKTFVVRYARSFTHPKSITSTELLYWMANGIDVAIVEESSADRALAGRAAGQNDARAARAAIVAIGGPADGVIYSAVDFNPTAAQMPAVLDYIRGFADVLGRNRTGVYGPYRVMKAAAEAGVCAYLWQTYAWSGGAVYPGIHLYQYQNSQMLGGVEVDFCRTSLADFGQWGAQTTLEDDMFEDADRAKLTAVYEQVTGAVAVGQADFRSTVRATLAAVQGVYNLTVTRTGALASQLTDFKAAVLVAIASDPATVTLSEDQQRQLLDRVTTLFSQLDVNLDQADVAAIAEALRTDLGQRLLADPGADPAPAAPSG